MLRQNFMNYTPQIMFVVMQVNIVNVNCIINTLIYVHIFSYVVNKLEIWWVYPSPIEKV